MKPAATLPHHSEKHIAEYRSTSKIEIATDDAGSANSGFQFMTRAGSPRGTLEFHDRASGLRLHTAAIEAIHIDGDTAWVWGKADVEGVEQRFRLRLVDAGEPGNEDRFELTLASGYEAGHDGPITGGNIQIHR